MQLRIVHDTHLDRYFVEAKLWLFWDRLDRRSFPHGGNVEDGFIYLDSAVDYCKKYNDHVQEWKNRKKKRKAEDRFRVIHKYQCGEDLEYIA